MLLAIAILGVGALFASGVLFQHQRMLTYLAAAGIIFEGRWLVLTLIDRTVLEAVATTHVFTVGAVVMLVAWLPLSRKWSLPYKNGSGSGRRDLVVLLVLAAVLLASWLVVSRNGFDDTLWVMRGYYNGDTTTFISLVQRSQLTSGLVVTNPFAGGGALEYPTLLHAGVATLVSVFGEDRDWLHFLPTMTYAQIGLTIPMLFLLLDVVVPNRKRWGELLLQGAVVMYVLMLSWEGYIYPQSHFFLSGLLLLQVTLLLIADGKSKGDEWIRVAVGSVIALVLLRSNAVTGTVAVAAIVLYYVVRALRRGGATWWRGLLIAGVPVWVALFMIYSPGNASFGSPHFSYMAARSMMVYAPAVLLLAVAVWLKFERFTYLTVLISALFGMAIMTFLFSTRAIVAENAERFIYHGLLFGWPLALGPITQAYYWLRRRLLYTSLSWPQRVAGWATVLAVLFVMLAAPVSIAAQAHDRLMFGEETTVGIVQQETLGALAETVPEEAVFLADPDAPWFIPLFTGRALLRADYWLGLDDEVLADVRAALAGDVAAQERAVRETDYVLLTQEEIELWDVSDYEPIITSGPYRVYEVRSVAGDDGDAGDGV